MSTSFEQIARGVLYLVICGCSRSAVAQPPASTDFEALPYAPRTYVCQTTATPLTIDGRFDERRLGGGAPGPRRSWTSRAPARPRLGRTRAKMLWDDGCFYLAAELEEPGPLGHLTDGTR